ncbi:MAG: rhodanese [Pirellulales bacterium]|nr:rhodanese [Pirellulales bacterium]
MSPSEPIEISVAETRRLRDSGERLLFIDCREADERAHCAIAGTRHIPMGELPDRLAELAAAGDLRVVIHCHHGGRSLRAANWLRQQGVAGAQSMAGGIDQWAAEIEPGMARY